METHEALAEAVKFLDDYSPDDFGTHEAFVAAAILWGDRIGRMRMRDTALSAMAEARDDILDLPTRGACVDEFPRPSPN
jgi:hypothetical protein